MSLEFDYRWAKDLVLCEMEQDGVLHRAKRIAMSAVCGSATNRALGEGFVRTHGAASGFAAAAAVFRQLAASPDPWSAAAAVPGDWLEAARRARVKAGLGPVPRQADRDDGAGRARVA